MLDERIVLYELESFVKKHSELKPGSNVVFEIDSNKDIVSFYCPDFDIWWICNDYQDRSIALVYHSVLSDLIWHIQERQKNLFQDFR